MAAFALTIMLPGHFLSTAGALSSISAGLGCGLAASGLSSLGFAFLTAKYLPTTSNVIEADDKTLQKASSQALSSF